MSEAGRQAPQRVTPQRGREQPREVGGFFATIREALRGSHRDYTDGPVGRAVLLLAIPMVLEMALESVVAVVNVFWVGRLGATAIATVGLTESLLAVVYALAIGISIAATATVARRIGEKDPDSAARAAVQVIALGIAVAIPVSVLGGVFARDILGLLGAEPAVIEQGGTYTTLMLAGSPAIFLLFLINAVFRAAGNAQIAMRVLWTGNVVNLVLDPLLIFGIGPFPELGVTGAAVATVTARSLAVLLQFYVLAAGVGRVAVARRHLRLEPDRMLAILRLSGSAVVQNLIGMASWLGLMRILAAFGDAALAGYTICIRVVIFALLPSWGMSNAAATLVGQNLGAGQPDRAQQSVMIAGFYNMMFLGCVGVVFLAAAGPIATLFTADAAVLPIAAQALRIISLGFVMYAWGMVLAQSFNGAGDTWTPTWLNLVCFWLLELPLAWLLARPLGLGPAGVFWSVAIAFSVYAVVGFAVFRRGRWRMVRV